MTSLAGCSGEAFASILRALGYQSEQRTGPAITVPLVAKAAIEPIMSAPSESAPADSVSDSLVAESEQASAEAIVSEAILSVAEEEEIDPRPAAAVADETAPEQPAADADAAAIVEQFAADIVPAASEDIEPEKPSAEEVVVPAAANAVTIEVWHPARHRKARRPVRAQAHSQKFRRQLAPTPALQVAAPAEAADPSTGTVQTQPDRRPQTRHRYGGGNPQAGTPRSEKKRDFQGKDARRGPRNGDANAKGSWSSAEKPRERQPDPNSPFAKLLVLKQRMEGQEGKN
jgi:ATP-dependent RNA helicase SUPV3L1/SUV3